jgi:hypothetical protein
MDISFNCYDLYQLRFEMPCDLRSTVPTINFLTGRGAVTYFLIAVKHSGASCVEVMIMVNRNSYSIEETVATIQANVPNVVASSMFRGGIVSKIPLLGLNIYKEWPEWAQINASPVQGWSPAL